LVFHSSRRLQFSKEVKHPKTELEYTLIDVVYTICHIKYKFLRSSVLAGNVKYLTYENKL